MNRSQELVEKIMDATDGVVGTIRLGGERIFWDGKKEIWIDRPCPDGRLKKCDAYMQIEEFEKNLSKEEIKEIENLPKWNGNNAYEICNICLNVVTNAILRSQGKEINNDNWR